MDAHAHGSSPPAAAADNAEILELFQRQVAERFQELSTASGEELLSLSWVRKLLDSFLCCQEEFRVILFNNRAHVHKPPFDKMISEYYERSIKALDVCNAIRDGIEQMRQWQRLLEIVLCALDKKTTASSLGEGQFRRAKKALIDLAIGMLDDKDTGNGSNNLVALVNRNRSFGRKEHHNYNSHQHRLGHFRSLSWSVSRSWSAARQLLAIGNNLMTPRGTDVIATNGLAPLVYTMNWVLLFVMWALVAAIPCQDRGLQVHFYIPRQFVWAPSMLSLHERILNESKKRERKNSCGLMKEIYQMERCARLLGELSDSVSFPLTEEKEGEVRQRVQEVAQCCGAMKEGLDPLERQVREVFHRIVRSRTDGLDSFASGHNAE
jgi:hypothetical protein